MNAGPLPHRDDPGGADPWRWFVALTELTVLGASFPAERAPDTRMLRLTRRLSLIGTPVAVVVEEIPLPRLSAAGGRLPHS